MPTKKAKLLDVKTFNLNVRISDELRPKIEYLKLLPGGITAFIERSLRELEVDEELLAKLQEIKK